MLTKLFTLGTASGIINTSAYSFAAQAYSDDMEAVVGLMETVVGIGCITAPVLGSFIYQLLGYSWTFYIFGVLMAPSCFLALLLGKSKE